MKYFTYIFNEILKLENNNFVIYFKYFILFEFPKNIYDKDYLFTAIFEHYLIEFNIQLETNFKFCIVYSLSNKCSSQQLNKFQVLIIFQVDISYEDEDFQN